MALSIKDWLNADEKDYGIGLAILGTNSKNRVLLQNLGRKQNPRKLEYELRKIAAQQGIDLTAEDQQEETDLTDEQGTGAGISETGPESDVDTVEKAIIEGRLTIVRGDREVKFEDLPEEMQARWNQNRDAYKEIRATHEKLKLMEQATPEDRAPLTSRIAELDDQIRVNWEAIDAWEPVKETGADDTAIDHKRINANRKYISTNLKKVSEDMDEVKAAKIRDEIKARLAELKAAGENLSDATIEELKKQGFEC